MADEKLPIVIRCAAVIRKHETGEERRTAFMEFEDLGDALFFWDDELSNVDCDCNRALYFERAGGIEPPKDQKFPCGDSAFSVRRLEMEDGTIEPVADGREATP